MVHYSLKEETGVGLEALTVLFFFLDLFEQLLVCMCVCVWVLLNNMIYIQCLRIVS